MNRLFFYLIVFISFFILLLPFRNYSQPFAQPILNPFSLFQQDLDLTLTCVDLDNDGDKDIISGGYSGGFIYCENIGNVSNPEFNCVCCSGSPFNFFDVYYNSKPAFADIDDDGDFDFFSGSISGSIYFAENIGTAQSPLYDSLNDLSLPNINNFYYVTPTFADLDNDGDLDLMSGSAYGHFYYFENTGSPSSYSFTTVQEDTFSLVSLPSATIPDFVDFDNDGDLDMFSGFGNFYYFENIGSAIAPLFSTMQINPFSLTDGLNISPAFVDLDSDGDLDVMYGDQSTMFYYSENILITSVGEPSTTTNNIKYYFENFTKQIFLSSTDFIPEKITIIDALGRIIKTINPINNFSVIDIYNMSEGIYFILVQNKNQSESFKIIVTD